MTSSVIDVSHLPHQLLTSSWGNLVTVLSLESKKTLGGLYLHLIIGTGWLYWSFVFDSSPNLQLSHRSAFSIGPLFRFRDHCWCHNTLPLSTPIRRVHLRKRTEPVRFCFCRRIVPAVHCLNFVPVGVGEVGGFTVSAVAALFSFVHRPSQRSYGSPPKAAACLVWVPASPVAASRSVPVVAWWLCWR